MDPQEPENGITERPNVRHRLEEAIRTRDSLQTLNVEFEGSTVRDTSIVFRLSSPAGEHNVELRRRDWADLDPNVVANFVAQKVVNEIRWRRNRG